MTRVAGTASIVLLAFVAAGLGQSNDCPHAFDGVCDEPAIGTGRCVRLSDTADCRGDYHPGGERSFFGRDDRIAVDPLVYPWSAIGKVYFSSGRSCTATLVAPNVALTAAHCLFEDADADDLDRPTEFIAGFDGHRYAGRADVLFVSRSPDFDISRYADGSEIDSLDWAFLVLRSNVGDEAGTMTVRQLTAGDLRRAMDGTWYPVMQAGYGVGPDIRLLAHIGCPIVEALANDTLNSHCDATEGYSGAPLFIEADGQYQIIAIQSAIYENLDAPYDVSMAVDSRAFYEPLIRLLGGSP